MTTTKAYDLLNRLTNIQSSAGGSNVASFGYTYNSANQRSSVTNGDNSFWVYQYDSLGQVISGKKYWSDGSVVVGQQFTYGFDDIGNRQTAAAGGDQFGANLRWQNYSVNNLNQYSQRIVPGFVSTLGTAVTNATVTVNNQSTYRRGEYFRGELAVTNWDAPVWLTLTNLAVLNNGTNADIITNVTGNVFVPKTPETFGYDADGNLTNDGRWALTWDGENRLVLQESLTNGPSDSRRKLEFVYDSQSRRIEKKVSTWNGSAYVAQSTNRFVYDAWNLIAVLSPSSQLLSSSMWGLDLSVSLQGAGGVGGLLQTWNADVGTRNFIGYDGNGNAAVLVNATNGAATANYEYGPFGELIRATGLMAKANPFRFSTKYHDDESDLVYYGYRSYNPSVGRWLNRDPIGERGGLNLYAFVWNDPVRRIDPFGLEGGAGFVAKLNCLCTCGPFKCKKAAQLADDALKEAAKRYPSSLHNGPGDAWRHCYWSCEMARAIGERCANFIAWDHENEGDRNGQPPEERKMDESNNASGRGFASQSGDCGDLCKKALDDGKLTVLKP